jgi:hypothetical protein
MRHINANGLAWQPQFLDANGDALASGPPNQSGPVGDGSQRGIVRRIEETR